MELIDKSALVVEIEKRREKNTKNKLNLVASFEDNYLLSFINTLEVKEVNLDKEIDRYYNIEAPKEFEDVLYEDIEKFAKHFFELGLKAKGE